MTLELPVLRLGLAGFTAEQQQAIEAMLAEGIGDAMVWEIAEFEVADAWWINGLRTQVLGNDRIRIGPGIPSGRSIQLQMPDIDRPLAFARPLPLGFQPLCSFDLASDASMRAVLQQFEAWLAPFVAQYSLASNIVEHQSALGSGTFDLHTNAGLLAIVDMQGEAAVRATATPADFEEAFWKPSAKHDVPEDFARTSLAQLMWQYVVRTQRDVLPRHYRTGLLYFRRAPTHLRQSLLKDSHLLIMRELMLAPATFEDLQQRCGFSERRLARELAALYFVGSITSNPKRAARSMPRDSGRDSTSTQSHLDSEVPSELPARKPAATDLTAPAPLWPR